MDHNQEIATRIAPHRDALNALRFFTATTRGFRDREQRNLAAFLREVAPLGDMPGEAVVEWLKTKAGWIDTSAYRRGDVSGYEALLRKIPAEQLQRTADYARLVAAGSGRRRIPEEWETRIQREFAHEPVVLPPPPPEEPGLAFQIGLDGVHKL